MSWTCGLRGRSRRGNAADDADARMLLRLSQTSSPTRRVHWARMEEAVRMVLCYYCLSLWVCRIFVQSYS